MKPNIKNDRYRKMRGGYSRLLQILCVACGTSICHYQKDGPGILKRMYLDRISGSDMYAGLENTSPKLVPPLKCTGCSEVLGMPIIYKSEDRLAYRLVVGAVAKKIVKVT